MSNNNQKRTLWIMAAAGVFLLVVVGAAIILYSSDMRKNKQEHSNYDASSGWLVSSIDNANIDEAYKKDVPLSPFSSDYDSVEANMVFDANNVISDDSKDDKNASEIADSNNVKNVESVFASDKDETTIDLNKITKPSNVTAQNDFTAAQIESAKSTQKQPAKTTTKTATKITTATTKTVDTTNNTVTTTKKGSKSNLADKYWVQVGSFEDKNKADNARTTLTNQKMPVEVFTIEENGKLKYRVRVGPYLTKAEAENWRARVVKIQPFTDGSSYVVNSNAPAVK